MRTIPVDINAFMASVQSVVALDPVVDYDTGEQRKDRDGVPRWKLTVLFQEENRKRELVEVGFAAATTPEPSPGAELVLTGLVARHWETTNDYGTNSGVSLSAQSVGFKPAASSANGSRATAGASA
jgi:hypothetical protein